MTRYDLEHLLEGLLEDEGLAGVEVQEQGVPEDDDEGVDRQQEGQAQPLVPDLNKHPHEQHHYRHLSHSEQGIDI